MFRIRRIYDDVLPVNRHAIAEVQEILREQFLDLSPQDIEGLGERLRNPFKQRFRTVLFVAEKARRKVAGFASMMHDPELHFCYLDFLASSKKIPGRGIGAALYQRVRAEALALGTIGLFFECLPDDPDACSTAEIQKQNAARLKFYEQFGARPIVGTSYEMPLSPDTAKDMPHLVFDGLDQGRALRRDDARQIVKAILERKYADLCSPEYVRQVVESFRDDPVLLRDFRYVRADRTTARPVSPPAREPVIVFVNDKHDIHHVRERGYVESPARISLILQELQSHALIEAGTVKHYPDRYLLAVHDADFVGYLRRSCALAGQKKSVYPYVFPIRNASRAPRDWSVRAGYYCIDTFTPINANAYPAARRAVDCALSGADEILRGRRVVYALIRPPGHHAERRSFGGFCYFNNNAVAAQYLSGYGRVAILDVDYHHGNGQQQIFWERNDVFTVSLHGHPDFAYPYFSGFPDERGEGPGEGANLNLALPERLDGVQYRRALQRALDAIAEFHPDFLVVAFGLDPAKGDPTGTWHLTAKDFEENGRLIGQLELPTLVVQEGGYRTRTLGTNARHFFQGLLEQSRTT